MKIPIILCAAALMLAACRTLQDVDGQFSNKNGRIKIHPDGRFELIVEPQTSK